ncbi:MAG: TIGR03986 family CRISPR-associated RAMP protein, partial [Anaerolineae bacterium]
MSLPKHQNPTKDEFKATAPYNFVPLPEKVIPAPTPLPNHDVYARGYFTGSITCRLTTASPLYIRCGETPQNFSKAKKSQSPEFFTDPAAGAPTIPGSSLRGMLRAMVELVTYGKPQPVSSDRLVYRAVGGTASFEVKYRQRLMQEDGHNTYTPLVQAGYMQKRGPDWVIQPARQIGGVTFARILIKNVPQRLPDRHGCKNARKIWVKLGPYGYKNVREGHVKIKFTDVIEARNRPEAGFTEAVWVGSGWMPGKKFDRVIYLPDTRAGPIPIPAEMIDAYREQISPAQKNLLGNSGVLRPRQPVFYLREEGELVFFGPTLMMRLPYPHTPRDVGPPP